MATLSAPSAQPNPIATTTTTTPPDSVPLTTTENWIDHEFLFHNEHVKIVGPNTVSISGKGIIKQILRPGHGDFPLPKAAVEIQIVAKVQLTGEVFQDSRDPTIQYKYLAQKHASIWDRQLAERRAKEEKDLAEASKNGADKAEIDAMIKKHTKEQEEALTNHQTFVSTDNRQNLFWQATKFQFGEKEVVRGLELAVQTMKVGELALVTCYPEYAYTDLGIEDYIPDNAIIEYEVELLSAEGAAVQIYPGVMKKYIKKGQGWSTPAYNTTCDIYIEGSFAVESDDDDDGADGGEDDGENDQNDQKPTKPVRSVTNGFQTKQFLKRSEHPLQCRIDDVMLPEGLEECLKTMKKGEVALFEISKNVLMGNGFEPKRHSFKLPIPPKPSTKDLEYDAEKYNDLVVFYRVELVELHHHQEVWALKLDDRITESERMKEVANDFFRLGLQTNEIGPDVPVGYTLKGEIGFLARAISRYAACLDLYEHFAEYEQRQCTYDMISRVVAVQLACYNNLQMIYSKLKNHPKTQESASKAIELFMTPVDIYKHEVIDKEGNKEVWTTSNQDPSTATHTEPALTSPSRTLPDNRTEINSNGIDTNGEEGFVEKGPDQNNGGDAEEEIKLRDEVPVPPSHPPSLLSTKAVLVGKTFPKQTNTNNIFKTLYRRAQALLLLDDPEGAQQTLKLCYDIWDHKEPFLKWKESVQGDLAKVTEKGDQSSIPMYHNQPILMHGIIPLRLTDEKDDGKEKLFPVSFENVGEDIKKEIDKLKILIDKKQNTVKARSQKVWAKAFQD